MIDKLNIPLEEMEKLESKYGINLHVDQFEDENMPDAFFIIGKDSFTYLGSTMENVEKELKRRYGY